MSKPDKIMEGLWSFPIVLPNNPLKWLNCYVIQGSGGGRNLVIDTGFNCPECLNELLDGLEAIGIRPEDTDVFLSHLHSDHTGNGKALQDMGCRLLMSRIDYDIFESEFEGGWESAKERALAEGMPEATVCAAFDANPAVKYRSDLFSVEYIQDGDRLDYGSFHLLCVASPGHTPGHMCLYDTKHKIMFLGDHVLFDISPNICVWTQQEDSLGLYLENLKKIRSFEVELALPAHRGNGSVSMNERIDALICHHGKRLAEAQRIIHDLIQADAYQIAGQMTWRIHAKNWEEFPPQQKWFAFGETLAHLDYLVKAGRICRQTDSGGNISYRAATA